MPQYAMSNTGSLVLNPVAPTLLYPGDSVYLLGTAVQTPGQIAAANDTNVQFEAAAVSERSVAVAFAPRPGSMDRPGAAIYIVANANPGVAEIDVQNSPFDADGAYLTPTGSTAYKITAWTQVGGSNNYVAWAEFQPLADFFTSLKVIANPNAVSFKAKMSYV